MSLPILGLLRLSPHFCSGRHTCWPNVKEGGPHFPDRNRTLLIKLSLTPFI
ncbi:hypothetical protein HAT2_00002 [Candidatus Similichlamydia laticola]|uniref:Uncharacterized protein n=1 Tax=Candidatus Similichlamydia laticola TaxID=2170265 RepID=A0A369KE52_9BACT|nr:hypothetical protein HAT2_00002 [Candidatus Similichlamydia laticola]